FLVNAPACRIPDIDPFDTSVEEHIRMTKRIRCTGKPSITYQEQTMLRLNWTVINGYYKGDFSECNYQGIRRGSQMSDKHFIYTELSPPFHADINMTEEFIRVYCFSRSAGKIYTNFHSFIIPKPDRVEGLRRRLQKHLFDHQPKELLNVIMIGLDSVSRLNHIRSMPLTRTFLLKNLSAVELQGYTKVADNTFVNVVPMTTGKFVEELPWDENKRMEPFDKYNFIWKNFSAAGYPTLYAEDAPKMAIFTYLKRGFYQPPADFYNRAFSNAMEKHLSMWNNDHQCVGDRLETDLILDYTRDLARAFPKHPHFAFSFITRLTHDVLSNAVLADEVYHNRLQEFERQGIFNSSVVFLFSDHGLRFGSFRETYIGKLEERLPMVYVIFPKWFSKKYPEIHSNLVKNMNRLTTPFDIYETLKDILYFRGRPTGFVDVKQRGISLFEEIPKSRTCDHAGILPHWCVCMNQMELPVTDKFSRLSVKYLVSYINKKLSRYRDRCATLVLGHIKSVHVVKNNDQFVISLFQLSVVLLPGAGVFEATVRYDENTRQFGMAGEISRINKYGHLGDCVDMPRIRKFCFC
ncbi:hypothetical protein LOTGIDRAFT_93092, partial [Lottia gigantea]